MPKESFPTSTESRINSAMKLNGPAQNTDNLEVALDEAANVLREQYRNAHVNEKDIELHVQAVLALKTNANIANPQINTIIFIVIV